MLEHVPQTEAPPLSSSLHTAQTALVSGRLAEALHTFQSILEYDSCHIEAQHGLGLALLQLGRPREAVEWVAAAHLANPSDDEALRNLGVILLRLWRLERAAECFQTLVDRSRNARDMNLLGGTLSLMGRHAEGYPWLEKAEAQDPGNLSRRAALLQARAALFHWEGYQSDRDELTRAVDKNLSTGEPPLCSPFGAITLNLPPPLIRRLAHNQVRSSSLPSQTDPQRIPAARTSHPRFRIGYLSPDLHNHPVGLLMAPIFEAHDRTQFEICAYPLRTVQDNVRHRIEEAVDRIVPLDDLDDNTVASKLAQEELDILIDLVGFTNAARPHVLSQRPARIQAHFLGYPGTIPKQLADYQILHASRLGPEGSRDYDEALALLPETFIASEGFEEPPYIPSREELGLPADRFVFGFFGAAYRVDPYVFDAWVQILKAVPNSVLWVQNGHESARENLRQNAARYGLDTNRLLFSDWGLLSEKWHHTRADLWLDGWHVSSGTASIVAVWTSTPLLTLAGSSPQARTGAGVLSGAGLHELISHSPQDYIGRAIEFARSPNKLKEIRYQMKERRSSMPLFQVKRFTRHLESAYTMMLERAEQRLPAETFSVPVLSTKTI